jgi:hypothetical protein
MIFSDPDPTFQLASFPYLEPDSVSDPTEFFIYILNKNFIFVYPSWKCGMLHIMMR